MRHLLLFLIFLSTPAYADVWLQYDSTTGTVAATNSRKVSDDDLAKIGRAQILYTGNADPLSMMVDLTQAPPAIVPAPPPPVPPASEIDLIFNAMVQSGQIDPATVDPTLLAKVNASLAINGAKTISATTATGATTSVR